MVWRRVVFLKTRPDVLKDAGGLRFGLLCQLMHPRLDPMSSGVVSVFGARLSWCCRHRMQQQRDAECDKREAVEARDQHRVGGPGKGV